MSKMEFDPYSQRLARDVRNVLGHWFVHGLVNLSPDPAGLALARLDMDNLPDSHQTWVRDKILLYRQCAGNIPAELAASPLELGLELWRVGLFFESHEALEQAWQKADGHRRKALKALVQAVGSCVHSRRGAAAPAASLAAKAAKGLAEYGHSLYELTWLPKLVEELENSGPVEIGNFAWSTNDVGTHQEPA